MTAVEFIVDELNKEMGLISFVTGTEESYKSAIFSIIERAKEMEKEQHDKTAEEWWKEGAHYMESAGRAKWESFEQYYNETFKSE